MPQPPPQLPQPPPQPPLQLPLEEPTPNQLAVQAVQYWAPSAVQWPQTAVAVSSSSSAAAAPLHHNSPPFPADSWNSPVGWGESQLTLPPVLPTMLGPHVGYPAPHSPHAPAAENEPERAALIASLRTLLEQANVEVKEARAELKEARAELKEARAEARDAKIAEIRREHSEMRLSEKYNDLWREMKWRRDGWK